MVTNFLLLTFVKPAIEKLKRRHGPLPVSASLSYNPYYDASSQTFAAMHHDMLDHRADPYEGCGDPSEAPFVALPRSPLVAVVVVANQSVNGAEPVYVRDLTIRVERIAPVEEALRDREGLFIGNIMSGGRGCEGYFDVRIGETAKLAIPLFKQLAANNNESPPRLRIDSGQYAEICVRLWIDHPGKYLLRAKLDVKTAWRTEFLAADGLLSFITLTSNTDWPATAISEHAGGQRQTVTGESFRELLRKRVITYEVLAPPSIPSGRKVVVTGSCVNEAF